MDAITGIVTGDQAVVARLGNLSDRLRAELAVAVYRGAAMVLATAVQTAPQKTSRLRRSITIAPLVQTDSAITERVGPHTPYAAALEFGFTGTVNVREHLRMQTLAWGRPMQNPREVTVREHDMRMNIKARSYMRNALATNLSGIRAELEAAVSRASAA